MLWARERSGASSRVHLAAVRLTAFVGVLSVVAFIAGSAQVGAVCLTCLGTYVLVAGYAALAALCAERRLPATGDLVKGAGMALIAAALVGGVVWVQAQRLGSERPTGAEEVLRVSGQIPAGATPDEAIAAVIEKLPPDGRQFISALRQYYATAPTVPFAREPRKRWGPGDAPVRIVDWTDVRCPHCRDLLESMEVVKRIVPPGRISVESRQYPLDSECNRSLKGTDGSGVRCLGARAQICVEETPEYGEIVSKLFAAQASLTPEKILDIAGSGSMSREVLDRCVKSPETERKLQEDVAYADHFQPRGTPFVIINGKVMPPVPLPVFVYLLALADGRTDRPGFAALPPPPPPDPRGE
jgi:serine/threonine-protein kinase